MAKKKNTPLSASEEENVQAQAMLAQYQQIAHNLHDSTDQKQAETALAEINGMSEGAQITFIKVLSKENQIDAADVLTAIHALSPLKSARKEAKRSLIRLESAKIYPGWEPPLDRSLVPGGILSMTTPPRFWKGFVTDSLESGEVQLMLVWEQGDGYNEVRVIGFLLEFWHDGVKDAFTQIESKRSFESFLADMTEGLEDVALEDCSLAKGRSLLLKALETNKKHGTSPHRDYRLSLSLIKQLILDVPGLDDIEIFEEEEEEEEASVELNDLKPIDVIANFVEFHAEGNYEIPYRLLAQNSPLHAGLTKEEWIERRKDWEQQANPGALEPNFLYERTQTKPRLWVPKAQNTDLSTTKELEASWSLELEPDYPNDTLPELLESIAFYTETGRRWFWANFTLVQEDGGWRIQNITDEGKNIQNLSIEELQKKIQATNKYMTKFMKKHTPQEIKGLEEDEALNYIGEVARNATQIVYYTSSLIKKLPLDRELYESAAANALAFNQYELGLVYLLPLTQRFPEHHGLLLRQVAAAERQISSKYEENDDERAERFQKLAEEALRESLTTENSFEAHMSLAELLINANERLDEAKDHLLQAKDLMSGPDQEAHVELHLGEIATEQERLEDALTHYQRIVQLVPGSAEGWSDLGKAHKKLDNVEEAITSYQHAIELDPESEEFYYELSRLYADNAQFEKAIDVLQDALVTYPDSTALNIYLASLYMENDNDRMAEIFLKKAERIEPDSEMTQLLRQVFDIRKAGHSAPNNQPRKLLKQKRKNR